MPDVVQTFINTKQMNEVLRIQRDIVRSYEDDMVKYAVILISSQIEGTQCTLDDVLDPEVETNANLDVSDVINCSLKDARYIPPNVEDMQNAMSDLEKYINENADYDPLIRVALIHYQFETIHPFLDGTEESEDF